MNKGNIQAVAVSSEEKLENLKMKIIKLGAGDGLDSIQLSDTIVFIKFSLNSRFDLDDLRKEFDFPFVQDRYERQIFGFLAYIDHGKDAESFSKKRSYINEKTYYKNGSLRRDIEWIYLGGLKERIFIITIYIPSGLKREYQFHEDGKTVKLKAYYDRNGKMRLCEQFHENGTVRSKVGE